MSRTIRWSATVFVLASLTLGAAQAWPLAQARPDIASPGVESRLEAAWGWLVGLFRPAETKPDGKTPSGTQEKDGCSADPNGRPPLCG